jgi:membrane-bound serine protease (ClpP class)
MTFIQDPNVVYLLLLIGMWASVFGIYIPGTGIVEVFALVALVGAFLLLVTNPLTNWLAAILLGIGVFGYLLVPLFRRDLARLALVGLALQAIGGFFLFSDNSVSALVIAATVGISLAFYQLALLPFLNRQASEPAVGDDELLAGATGWVVTALDPIGTVNVRSEIWTAYSDEPLQPGERITVIAKEGLRLHVERAKSKGTPRPARLVSDNLVNDGELPQDWENSGTAEQIRKE